MSKDWKEKITCATECSRCHRALRADDERILSVYDHEAVCLNCKEIEEQRPDYKDAATRMIENCTIDLELKQSDPGSYCYSHFYPYKC